VKQTEATRRVINMISLCMERYTVKTGLFIQVAFFGHVSKGHVGQSLI